MIRHLTVVVFLTALSPSWLCAQTTEFTVKTESARIYKAPSTSSVVIGEVPRGTVFEVTRELGSWVKVPWPAGPDGGAYVHVTWGTVTHNVSPASRRATNSTSAPTAQPVAAQAAVSANAERTTVVTSQVTSPGAVYVVPPTHRVGLGGRIGGSTRGYGATARAWSRGRLGLQVDASRYELTAPAVPGRVVSMQIAPTLLFSLANRVTDFVWVRPYLGAGPGLFRQTFSAGPAAGASATTNRFGFQSFGGGEFSFASSPRFAVSADVGYRWVPNQLDGFDFGGPVYSVSAHWYVK